MTKYQKLVAACKKKDEQLSRVGYRLEFILERAVRQEVACEEATYVESFVRRPRITANRRRAWQEQAEATIANWVEKFRHPEKHEARHPGGWPLPRNAVTARDVIGYRHGILTAWALTQKLYKERG